MTHTVPDSVPVTSDEPPYRYTAALAGEVEHRWQDRWEAGHVFAAPNPAGPLAERGADRTALAARPKRVVLDMFPYPSGAGLHVGHPLGYIATDVYSRYRRMQGDNVLHTMGFDAFGLPAEQYAVQTGTHPRETTERNIEIIRRELRRLGMDHDPRRSVSTIDPAYYRWTQWIFTQLFEAWYDTEAGRARPVRELVAAYERGDVATPDGRPWAELDAAERRDAVDARRLAYLAQAPVNWCPGLGTVLANEEVTADGRSERGNFPVFKRNLRQWMMRITAYADRLIEDLDRLDWPEPIKLQQRNWIGRSHGATIRFPTGAGDIEVFTTRPDTTFGATFVVVAPEHPLVPALTPDEWPVDVAGVWTGGHATPADAVGTYREQAARKSEIERQSEGREKTGVFTGSYAMNPASGALIPVFVADYVLTGYGTGAIMAVPGQDERDWEFATRFELPIIRTVQPPEGWTGEAFTGDGPAVNSANDDVSLNGLDVATAKERIIAWLEQSGRGAGTVTYRLRDWLFSRQRYWGEPFPIVYSEDGTAIALPVSMLPVELPEVDDYSPRIYPPDAADSEPEAPLARATEWVEVELDLGELDGNRGRQRYRRETNTMPNWAGSCWYELRYLDPTNDETFCDPAVERYWLGPPAGSVPGQGHPGGVDLYVGGAEHAVLHLLYARFWHKALFDLGHVSSEEPFYKLVNQGMIQAPAYTDERGMYVDAHRVVERDGGFWYDGAPVSREFGKIGKSLRNVITPADICAQYGVDTFRLYEMSTGPLEASRPWEPRAVVGSYRFLQRVWRNVVDETTGALRVSEDDPSPELLRLLHRTIAGVSADYDALRVNTAIAKLIELNNVLTRLPAVPRQIAEALVLMLAPPAPHIAEELWARLGHRESLAREPFPVADPALLVEETVTCVVQVAGKVRDRLEVPADITEDDLRERALGAPGVLRALDGRGVRTVVVRAPRLVNVVPA